MPKSCSERRNARTNGVRRMTSVDTKLLQLKAINSSIRPLSVAELSIGEFRRQIELRSEALRGMRSIQSRLRNLVQETNLNDMIELCRGSRPGRRRRVKTLASPARFSIAVQEKRRFARDVVRKNAKVFCGGQSSPNDCVVWDLTSEGACLRFVSNLHVSQKVELSFDQFRSSRTCRVVWQEIDRVGVRFAAL